MKQPAPDFYLIAHSHGLSLLDGITDWRKKKLVVDEHDPRYGEAFQGWFNGSIMNDPFSANVIDNTVLLNKIEAWVITCGSKIGPLAKLESKSGTPNLRISRKFSDILDSWNGPLPTVPFNASVTLFPNVTPAVGKPIVENVKLPAVGTLLVTLNVVADTCVALIVEVSTTPEIVP